MDIKLFILQLLTCIDFVQSNNQCMIPPMSTSNEFKRFINNIKRGRTAAKCDDLFCKPQWKSTMVRVKNPNSGQLLFVTCYNHFKRLSDWSIYKSGTTRTNQASRDGYWNVHPCSSQLMEEDNKLYIFHRESKTHLDDQTRLQRGHYTPNREFDGDLRLETFLFLNAAPQYAPLNGIAWSHLEQIIYNTMRNSAEAQGGLVVTGSAFLDNEKVPAIFWKVVCYQGLTVKLPGGKIDKKDIIAFYCAKNKQIQPADLRSHVKTITQQLRRAAAVPRRWHSMKTVFGNNNGLVFGQKVESVIHEFYGQGDLDLWKRCVANSDSEANDIFEQVPTTNTYPVNNANNFECTNPNDPDFVGKVF